jgi:hypothetical protein
MGILRNYGPNYPIGAVEGKQSGGLDHTGARALNAGNKFIKIFGGIK